MHGGMEILLTIGWLVLGAYLAVLLALAAVIAAYEAVRNNLRRWTFHDTSRLSRQA